MEKPLPFAPRPWPTLFRATFLGSFAVAVLAVPGCEALDEYQARKEHLQAQQEQASERESAKTDGKEYRTSGLDFSVVVPDGYTRMVNEKILAHVGKDGLGLVADKRAKPGWFVASVAFARAGSVEVAATDADACKTLGKEMAGGLGVEVDGTQMRKIGDVDRCQVRAVVNADAHHSARFTVMQSPSATWTVTCNHDDRDEAAQSTCTEILESWKNTSEQRDG